MLVLERVSSLQMEGNILNIKQNINVRKEPGM